MYYIYHIPDFVWKNGSKGKIGCSETPSQRVNKQGYTDYEILESHECMYEASKREIELQKEYGYPVDSNTFAKAYTQGKKNVESGHLKKISKLGAQEGWKVCHDKHPHVGKLLSEYARTNFSKSVLQYDLDGNFIAEYYSMREAGRQLNRPHNGISNVLKGKQKTAYGFIWKYKENNLDN